MYIRAGSNQSFPFFLTCLLYNVRFLISMVDFASPPPQVYLPNYAYVDWPIFLSLLFSILVAAVDVELR